MSDAVQDLTCEPREGPWRTAALEHGLRSVAALPLKSTAGTFGVLLVASAQPDVFSPGEVRFLEQLASDLSLGVVALRAQGERARAEQEVLTLNRELERRVADRTAQLELANKELEAFTYSVSHDLRAPLRHIDGYLGLLVRSLGGALAPDARRYLDTIGEAARRMGELIEDLLAFSRMGRQEMAAVEVDLGELVARVIAELGPELQGRTVEWHVAPLPVVQGDRAMLRTVFVNLLSNAVKFTRRQPRATIEIGTRPGSASETVVFVKDNGVGFDMQYVGKLFGVFQRLHRVDEFEGTGIGLANVHRVIKRHGGRAWAEAQVNAGATFFFSLPHPGSSRSTLEASDPGEEAR